MQTPTIKTLQHKSRWLNTTQKQEIKFGNTITWSYLPDWGIQFPKILNQEAGSTDHIRKNQTCMQETVNLSCSSGHKRKQNNYYITLLFVLQYLSWTESLLVESPWKTAQPMQQHQLFSNQRQLGWVSSEPSCQQKL